LARRLVRPLPLVLGLVGAAVAGTAAAYLIRQQRDVTTTSEKAYRLYHEGVENDLKMYYREAMASYAEALRYDPHFAMATLRLADKLRDRDPDRANALLASAVRSRDELTPREKLILDIWQERWGKRDLKKLEGLYDEYLRRFPKEPEGYQLRAMYLANNGKTPEAIAEYEKLISINPNYAIAYNTIGYYWATKGDYAKAEDSLKRYRFLAPDQANPFDSLGELYAHTGRYDEAEENLRKALAVKDDFYPAYGHLGTVEAGRGHYADAADWFRKAADQCDSIGMQHEFRFLSSMMLVDAGRPDDAVRAIDAQAAEIATLPATKENLRLKSIVQMWRAGILGRVGRRAEAETALAAVKVDDIAEPTSDEKGEKHKDVEDNVDLVRGVIAMGSGRDAEAVPLLSKAIERKVDRGLGSTDYLPPQLFSRLALAKSLGRLGRVEEAEKALAPILARNPRFAPALEMIARIRGEKPATAEAGGAGKKAGSAS
jgi:tetratricopeptide (TPR) repeat protein